MKIKIRDVPFGECFTWEEPGVVAIKVMVCAFKGLDQNLCYGVSSNGTLISIPPRTMVLYNKPEDTQV